MTRSRILAWYQSPPKSLISFKSSNSIDTIQDDDVYYLYGAEYAQIEPAHPTHVEYMAPGDLIDMEGYFHPPLNAYILGGMLAVIGDIREVSFHATYTMFSLICDNPST